MSKVYLVGSLKTDVISDLIYFTPTASITTGFGRTLEVNGVAYQVSANKKLIICRMEGQNGTATGGIGVGYATESGYKDVTTFAGIQYLDPYAIPLEVANKTYEFFVPITIPANATGFYPLIHARGGSGYYKIIGYETD